MAVQAFVYALAAGAAAIAAWIFARYTRFGPRSLFWAAVHAVVAYCLLRLAPVLLRAIDEGDVVVYRFVAVFGVALPMFVYGFLSGAWVTRAAVGLLRR